MLITFIVPVPPVMLLKVFPVIVLVGAAPPSVKFNPVMVEVPATVTLEKLLLITLESEPAAELPLSLINKTED